jgi:UDP-N-acetylmuramoylalanine--D-glutamate ligase
MSFINSLAGKSVLVVGGGVTGKATANYLTSARAVVQIFEERAIEGIANSISTIDAIAPATAMAVISPGWRAEHPVIQFLQNLGVEVISEIDLAWRVKLELAPEQKWLAVTGTNGKTTTVSMVESIFAAAGINGIACGNVGRTVIEAVSDSANFQVLVLELSSFQLEWSAEPEFLASAILNVAPDHIDWHGGFAAYLAAKLKIFDRATWLLVNRDDPTLAQLRFELTAGERLVEFTLGSPALGQLGMVEELLVDRAFGGELLDQAGKPEAAVLFELSDIKSPVPHNVSNALAAAGLARAYGISGEQISLGLRNFSLGDHRIQQVAKFGDITWVNDSKATNPHAALASFSGIDSVIWIAGGLAKGAEMGELVEKIHHKIKRAIIIGSDGELIARELRKYLPSDAIIESEALRTLRGGELMALIASTAANLLAPGDTVLLAPACASMDQFNSYADRGNLFSAQAHKWELAQG